MAEVCDTRVLVIWIHPFIYLFIIGVRSNLVNNKMTLAIVERECVRTLIY